MNPITDSLIARTYERVKGENPRLPEGVILARVADCLGLTTTRVGDALRQPMPIRRYAVICRHKNSDSGGLDNVGNL
jgi:hypothetical protein